MGLTQGAIYANGHRVVGCDLTINNGMFMDANNTIKALTEFKTSMTYEATEDCFVLIYIMFGNNSTIKIDNKVVGNYDGSGSFGISNTFYVKAGQTTSVSGASSSYNSYYIVYGIQSGSIAGQKVTTYHGVPVTANIYDDGYCNLTKVEFDDFILYNLDFSIHIKGTASAVEFLPFYTFDSGVLDDIDWRTMLTYCVSSNVYFARVRIKAEDDALGGYWGNFSVSDGWYTCTPTTFLVQKNQPSS